MNQPFLPSGCLGLWIGNQVVTIFKTFLYRSFCNSNQRFYYAKCRAQWYCATWLQHPRLKTKECFQEYDWDTIQWIVVRHKLVCVDGRSEKESWTMKNEANQLVWIQDTEKGWSFLLGCHNQNAHAMVLLHWWRQQRLPTVHKRTRWVQNVGQHHFQQLYHCDQNKILFSLSKMVLGPSQGIEGEAKQVNHHLLERPHPLLVIGALCSDEGACLLQVTCSRDSCWVLVQQIHYMGWEFPEPGTSSP